VSTPYDERLQAFVGRRLGLAHGQDPVNVPMVRHWVEAMEDANPVYLDEAAARATGRPGVVSPASMMQAWTMRGYAATVHPPSVRTGMQELADLLDEGGYTSVVATDSDFEFHRELLPGDEVSCEEVVEEISPEKQTALGPGRFVTTVRTYRDGDGATVATQRWRTLRFRPRSAGVVSTSSTTRDSREPLVEEVAPATSPVVEEVAPATVSKPPPLRPRPALNQDNAFWFEAAQAKRLVIQRCTGCKALRHPPGPACPHCHSFDWDTVEASGGGTVHSYVVAHHPRHPAFDYPLLVAVVALDEGTRLITNLVGTTPEEVRIDMPVALEWLEADPALTLPVFRPVKQEEH
jgi:uncharacterized OB-fold protein